MYSLNCTCLMSNWILLPIAVRLDMSILLYNDWIFAFPCLVLMLLTTDCSLKYAYQNLLYSFTLVSLYLQTYMRIPYKPVLGIKTSIPVYLCTPEKHRSKPLVQLFSCQQQFLFNKIMKGSISSEVAYQLSKYIMTT